MSVEPVINSLLAVATATLPIATEPETEPLLTSAALPIITLFVPDVSVSPTVEFPIPTFPEPVQRSKAPEPIATLSPPLTEAPRASLPIATESPRPLAKSPAPTPINTLFVPEV